MTSGTETSASKPKRSTRRLIIRSLLAIILLAGGLGVLRLTSLRGLPVIEPPFDPVRDGIVDIREEDNAFTYYIRAHEQLNGVDPTNAAWSWPNWESVDPAQLKFIDENREALATYLEGTKRGQAVYFQPGKLNFLTMLPAVQSLRTFARSANLVAFRYEHEGNYTKAWEWYRANLRASRHSGQHGLSIERIVGIGIYGGTHSNVIRWSDNPKVDLALLKQALKDVIELDALTGTPRNTICAEYFSMINSLEDLDLRMRSVTEMLSPNTPPNFQQNLKGKAIVAYATLRREPERSKRVIQLLIANWLTVADLPSGERQKRTRTINGVPYFSSIPGQEPAMPGDTLMSWYQTTVYARIYLTGWGNIDKSLSRDEQNRAALIVHLAEQIYLREHGKPTTSTKDLVGPYLNELPVGYVPLASTGTGR